MEIKDMTTQDIEVRSAEIEKEIAEGGDVEKLSAEVEALEERKAQIEKEAEERKALLNEVAKTSHEVEPLRKENNTMEELRNSKQYIDAYARYIKTGDDRECRTLMTENVTGDDPGTLPVPQFVADILHAELRSDIVDGFRKMRAKGNVAVPVEINAPAAAIHMEGKGDVEEEDLEIRKVLLTPITYKKWVGISDEALDVELMDSRSYLEYVYDEIARGIMKAREENFFSEVYRGLTAMPVPMTATVGTAAVAAADFINARAKLNADARDLVVILPPSAYAAYRALQLSAQYPFDIFDGMKVIIRDLPNSMRFIVGDLRGYMENLPNGENIQFKKDDHTLMTRDIVRVLGRLPASVGIVGYKYFVTNGSGNAEG